MFTRRPIRSLLKRKPKTRSAFDPYTTEELNDIFDQINMGFGTIKQFMTEISVFIDFEASEFLKELTDTIAAIDKYV